MIYLIAYNYRNKTVMPVNRKGQFIGSTNLQEVIDSLPKYNWYNRNNTILKDAAPHHEVMFLARIVSCKNLKEAYDGTHKEVRSRRTESKWMCFKEIVTELSYTLNLIDFKQQGTESVTIPSALYEGFDTGRFGSELNDDYIKE